MSNRGEYRAILTVLWNGPDFQQLSPQARLVWLALKGNCGPCGIAAIPGLVASLVEWTGYDEPQVTRALSQLEGKWVRRERNVVWVVDGIIHEPSRNANDRKHRVAAQAHVASLPRLDIVRTFIHAHREWFPRNECEDNGLAWVWQDEAKDPASPFEAPSKPLLSTETETETETDSVAPDGAEGPDRTEPKSDHHHPSGKPAVSPTDAEAAVIAHYRGTHPRRRPGDKDIRAVRKALGLGYSVGELCEAIDGNARDAWHAERGKHELPYVLRDNGLIDNFREKGARPRLALVDPDTGLLTEYGERVYAGRVA